MANLEQKQQLQAIKDAEVEARNKKALAYLSSQDGKALTQQIQSQYEKFVAQQKKEGAYLKPLQDKVDALTETVTDPRISSLDREIANEQLRQAVGALAMAGQHKDSPELTKLRQNLLVLFAKFKANSGMGYDDAMKLSQDIQTK